LGKVAFVVSSLLDNFVAFIMWEILLLKAKKWMHEENCSILG